MTDEIIEEQKPVLIAEKKVKGRLLRTGRMQTTLDEDIANELRRLRRTDGIIIRTSINKMLRESLKI
jgi:hypothetical protein